MINRKQKIELLKGIAKGEKSILELMPIRIGYGKPNYDPYSDPKRNRNTIYIGYKKESNNE